MPSIITNQKTLNFKLDKMGVKMILTSYQIENMIYAGFDSMSKFIDKRRSQVKEEYDKRLEYADIK